MGIESCEVKRIKLLLREKRNNVKLSEVKELIYIPLICYSGYHITMMFLSYGRYLK